MTACMYVVAAILGIQLGDTVRFLGSLFTPMAAGQRWVGGSILGIMALVWGWLYPRVRPSLPGSGWRAGLYYGLLVWLLSTVAIFPLIAWFHPAVAAAQVPAPGLLAFGFGYKAAAASLLVHALYGIVLGSYVGTLDGNE